MKKYIIILFASLMVTNVQAQDTQSEESSEKSANISVKEMRSIYQKIYSFIQDYAQNAPVSDEEEEYNFRKLFVSDNLQIGNDLMSLSHKPTLSVDDYIATLKKAKSVKVAVKNLKKVGTIKETEGAYTMRVSFEKNISYSNCGTYFESETYFEKPYKLLADLSIDKENGICKISGLTNDLDQKLEFPEKYTVLVRTPEDENKRNFMRDDKLTINGKEVHDMWNRFGQIILKDEPQIKYNNAKVGIEEFENEDCGGRKVRAKYNDQSFRIKVNGGFSLSGFNKLDGPKDGLTSDNSEKSFGLDFGYVFPSNSKFYFGIFTGFGLSKNKLTMNYNNPDYIISEIENCIEDEDGDYYTRIYRVNGMSGITQEFDVNELAIPVYADFEYQVHPVLSIYANVGTRIQATADKWTAEIGEYTTSGKYHQYNNLIIDGSTVNLNGFGKHPGGSIEVDETGWTKKTSISALMGLGIRANIAKNFAVDAGMQYLAGFKSSWNGDNEDNAPPLFSYTLAEGDKVNLLTQTKGIKRNALRLTLGLIFKF